jgi:hypothetical protein
VTLLLSSSASRFLVETEAAVDSALWHEICGGSRVPTVLDGNHCALEESRQRLAEGHKRENTHDSQAKTFERMSDFTRISASTTRG